MAEARAQETVGTPAAIGVEWRIFQIAGLLTAVSWFVSYFLFLDGYTAIQVVFGTDRLLWFLGGIGYVLSPLMSVVLIAIAVWPGALAVLNRGDAIALGARAVLFVVPFLWLGSVFVGDTAMIDRMLANPMGHSVALPITGGAFIHTVFQHWFQGFAAMLLAFVPSRFSTLTDSDQPAGTGAALREVTAEMEIEHRLAALHEATREMMQADSPREVATIASDASRDVLGIQHSRVHLQDDESDELVPAAWTDEMAQAVGGELPTVDAESGLVWERFQSGEPGYFHDYEAMEGAADQETPLESSLLLPLGDHGIMLLQSTEPAAVTNTKIELAHLLSANTEAALARTTQERELDLVRSLLDQSSECVFVLAPDSGRVLDVNEPACHHLGYSRDDLLSLTLHDIVGDLADYADVETLLEAAGDKGLWTLEGDYQRRDGSTFPVHLTVNHLEVDQPYLLVIAKDVTEQKAHLEELSVQRTELDLLGVLQRLTNAIVQQVVGSTSRADIELQACELLTESRFYTDAWLVDTGQDEAVSDLIAGPAGGTPDGGTLRRLDDMPPEAPVTEAVHDTIKTESPQVVPYTPGLPAASAAAEAADTAADAAAQTAITLPLTYTDANYGAMVVITDRPSPFEARETAALETLTLAVALSIHVRLQESTPQDDAIELEFHASGASGLMTRLATAVGCPVQLYGLVPTSDDTVRQYYAVETETAADALRDRVQSIDAVAACRVLDHDDRHLIELEGRSADILDVLVDAGAVIQAAEARGDDARLVIHLSPDTPPAEIKPLVQAADPAWTLTTERQVERPLRPVQEARQVFEESLTDKQREALLTAYFAGYYDHPRTANAQEVADMLAITDSTLFQHLQAAQRKLIGHVGKPYRGQ